jgi:arylsulfatase A-like enzyme
VVCGSSVAAAWIESLLYSPPAGADVGVWLLAIEGSLGFWFGLPAALALAASELWAPPRWLALLGARPAMRSTAVGLAWALFPLLLRAFGSHGLGAWTAALFVVAVLAVAFRKLPTVGRAPAALVALLGAFLLHGLAFFAVTAVAAPVPALSARAQSATAASDAPCVLLISVDTLRDDRVGAQRDGKAVTPFLDRLAAEGLRATTIAVSNQTGPGHAALLTGAHSLRSGVIANGWTIPPDVVSLAELLRDAGWRTGGIVSNPVIRGFGGFARGFESYGEVSRLASPASQAFFGARRKGSRWRQLDARPALAMAWLRHAEWRVHMTPKWLQPTADDTLRRCSTLLGELEADPQPWFLFAHFMDPHHPYDPPPPTLGTWTTPETRRGIPLSSTEQFHAYRDVIQARVAAGDPSAARHVQTIAELYDEEILFLDAQLEQLVTRARAAAGARPLWIVLTSDHGEHLFEHSLLGHSNSLYEELVRLPLIVHGVPDVTPADLPARQEDVARVLARRLLGARAAEVLAAESPPLAEGHSVQIWGLRAALRTPRWKLFAESDAFRGEYRARALWDMSAPDGEFHDFSAQHPEVVRELLAELHAMIAGSAAAPRPTDDGGVDERMERTLEQLGYADH